MKDISERVEGKGNFSYSRFFAIGLFRLLELANATEPAALEKVVLLPSYELYFSSKFLVISLFTFSRVTFISLI